MPQNTVDLVNIFQTVTQTLAKNQKTLDHADTYNQDHGTNMLDTFQTITGALEKKKGSTDSAALAYAAKTLSQKAKSSSGKQYAQNLSKAAGQFKGKKVDEKGALQLLQTLIGSQTGQTTGSGGQAAGGNDMLGTLLGGLAGGETPSQASSQADGGDMLGALLGSLTGGETPSQASTQAGGGDMLGALLGSLAGGETPSQASSQGGSSDMLGALLGGLTGGESGGGGKQDGIQLGNLIAGGLAYLQAKQSGKGNLEALVQAFVAGSSMGSAAHRTQSTQMVVQSFLQALSSAGSRS